jgi:hypothetical protein
LIELQIKATPQRVGPPIDILQLDASGAAWIGRSQDSACAAVP